MSKAKSGRSSSGADNDAGPHPFVVVMELRATDGLLGTLQVAKELLDATDINDSPSVEILPLELQLVVTFKVLHRLDIAERRMSLSTLELDLIEFLVAQVALLSSSLACEVVITESPAPPSVACEVADLQSDLVIPSVIPPRGCGCSSYHHWVMDPLWWPWSFIPLT
jgi:hypothetical protein